MPGVRAVLHAVVGGLTDAHALPGQGRDPVRARPAASSAWCAPRSWPGFDKRHRLRHGRHLDRRVALRRRVRARVRDAGRRRAHARADDEHPHGRRRRRLDPAASTARAFASARDSAGANPGPGLLSARRPARGDRANVMLGKIQPAYFPQSSAPQRRRAARRARSCARKFAELAREIERATGTRARRRRSPKASSTSRSATWPTRSRRSRCSAATTSRATRCTASAAPAASTPAWWPTRSA